jgi:hypothetical protein
MSFLGKLLESGAPWWVVVGLIVFVVGALLLLAGCTGAGLTGPAGASGGLPRS